LGQRNIGYQIAVCVGKARIKLECASRQRKGDAERRCRKKPCSHVFSPWKLSMTGV
jgi:hypothetical protein